MTPYDETKPMTCRACGATGAHAPTYCDRWGFVDGCGKRIVADKATAHQAVSKPFRVCAFSESPHLDITCHRCGFVWPMALAEVKA